MTRLELEHVSISVGRQRLLDDVTLGIDAGEFVAVVGPNGAGKTTLLRAALGLLTPASGKVTIDGQPAQSLRGRQRAAHLAWLPQQLAPSEPLCAAEVVSAARYRFDEPRTHARRRALEALERLRVAHLAEARVDRLSGGERQRVALAALLAQEADILLVDEPANHLDPVHQAETYRLLGELWRQGYGVVCVTHDVNLLAYAGGADELRVVGLAQGKLAFEERYASDALGAALASLFGIGMTSVQASGRRFFVPEFGGPA